MFLSWVELVSEVWRMFSRSSGVVFSRVEMASEVCCMFSHSSEVILSWIELAFGVCCMFSHSSAVMLSWIELAIRRLMRSFVKSERFGSGDLQKRGERKRNLIQRPIQQALTVSTALNKKCTPNSLEDGRQIVVAANSWILMERSRRPRKKTRGDHEVPSKCRQRTENESLCVISTSLCSDRDIEMRG